jgi:hypothetical protein
VPLNTVRDLLGHGSVQMSLRYAHLAPDQRREAVSKLNDKPVSCAYTALTVARPAADVLYPTVPFRADGLQMCWVRTLI